jgi:hypothetical protein
MGMVYLTLLKLMDSGMVWDIGTILIRMILILIVMDCQMERKPVYWLRQMAGPILPTLLDGDQDGIDDPDELILGTNPLNSDLDNDGIIDSIDPFYLPMY